MPYSQPLRKRRGPGSGPVPGDFNGVGGVDGDDLAQWEGDFGTNGDSDADGDGDSDGTDFLIWQQNFNPAGEWTSMIVSVPEPISSMLMVLALVIGTINGSFTATRDGRLNHRTSRLRCPACQAS